MLQTMRQLAHSWVVKGLMLILVVSFSIWGIGDIFRGNPMQRHVAKIGGEAITVQELDKAFSQALENARRELSPDITRQQAAQMGVLDSMLTNLIERAGLEQDVVRLGINVSDKEFLDQLATTPQFTSKDGTFDKARFRQVVQNSGMSERQFFDLARSSMEQQQLINSLRIDLPPPRLVSENLYRARGQKRIADMVTVKNDGFADVAAPDDKALHDFYDKNQARFLAPEYRAVTIARLSADDFAKDISVSDADVKKEYDAQPAPIDDVERRDVVQATVPDEAKAKELAAAARAGGDLTVTAKKLGYDPLTLARVEQKGLLPGVTSKVFALAEGAVSDPIQSASGWQVAQVKKIYPAGKPPFDKVKDEIRRTLQHDRAADNVANTVNQLDDQLAAGHALEDIADSLKLRLIKIPMLDANGMLPGGQAPAELPDRDLVLKAAFGQAGEEASPVLDDKQGNYTVVRTDTVVPAAVPPFDKIKDAVTVAWTETERAHRAAAAAEEIARGLRDGKPAESFAGQTGVAVRVSKPISMAGDRDPDLPPNAVAQIEKMKKDEVAIVATHDSQIVLRLSKLIDADPAADKYGVDHIADQIRIEAPSEFVAEYVKYMRVLYPVEIYQSVLDGVKQQGG